MPLKRNKINAHGETGVVVCVKYLCFLAHGLHFSQGKETKILQLHFISVDCSLELSEYISF